MIIKTPARLHLGIIDLSNSLNRRFGSLGIGINNGYKINITKNSETSIKTKNSKNLENAKKVIKTFNKKFNTTQNIKIEIQDSIPRHVGLGSTTQLKLGIGMGINKILKLGLSVEKIARTLGRGNYNSVGTYVFKNGGFILDGGFESFSSPDLPPLLFREKIPKEWGFIIALPKGKGLNEVQEKPILKKHRVKKEIAEKMSHRIILGLLPNLKERNISKFGSELNKIQDLVGESFSNFQNGKFHKSSAKLVKFLRNKTFGSGQSSWGPGVYGIVKKSRSKDVLRDTKNFLMNESIEGKAFLASPDNHGFLIDHNSEGYDG